MMVVEQIAESGGFHNLSKSIANESHKTKLEIWCKLFSIYKGKDLYRRILKQPHKLENNICSLGNR